MRNRGWTDGWRGVALVAAVYVYFLIFAQFAFLARVAELGIAGNALKLVMATMAAGGILFSVAVAYLRLLPSPASRIRAGFAVCALAAGCTTLTLTRESATGIAFLIGAGVGIVTVTVVTHLRRWAGHRMPILMVGVGTGLGYFICNIPAVFAAPPGNQAMLAAAVCLAAMALPLGNEAEEPRARLSTPEFPLHVQLAFPLALAAFFALVWLDSAAFYIIQHSTILKAGTWMGSAHLWTNGTLHLSAAVAAGFVLQRGRAQALLACSFAALGFACVLLANTALIPSASLFYPIGVSLYSVALVAYPSFLAAAHSESERARQAGWIYATAGWIGSALGIGMGQNLGRVPVLFVVAAGAVVLGPFLVSVARSRPRELALVCAALLFASLLHHFTRPGRGSQLSAAQRGKQVYISEGCISCHSQYVRFGSPDILMWGPAETMQQVHAERPPLIGNRRQGPDLSQVGARRSPMWLKAHTVEPRDVSYKSVMPSYAFLFQDGRGDDLVAYLASLGSTNVEEHFSAQAAWTPSPAAWQDASLEEGARVYQQHCATCHDSDGTALRPWHGAFKKAPPDLNELQSSAALDSDSKLAQIAKFGLADTDMPGHEYLEDREIASVTLWLKYVPHPHS